MGGSLPVALSQLQEIALQVINRQLSTPHHYACKQTTSEGGEIEDAGAGTKTYLQSGHEEGGRIKCDRYSRFYIYWIPSPCFLLRF